MTCNEIGSLLGLGEARVRRLFKREVGKGLRPHLLEVRMARAAQLLRNVAAPIKTVACDCGYTVVSNFYRDFKRVHGISPKQMRLRHLRIELVRQEIGVDQVPAFRHSGAAESDRARSLHLVATRRKISA